MLIACVVVVGLGLAWIIESSATRIVNAILVSAEAARTDAEKLQSRLSDVGRSVDDLTKQFKPPRY
jgi:hypothetical protein